MAAKARFTKVFAIDPVPERMGECLQLIPLASVQLIGLKSHAPLLRDGQKVRRHPSHTRF